MSNRPSLDDYVDVAERIQDFKDAHPDGSLQTISWEIQTVEGIDPKSSKPVRQTFIVYRAAAFRDKEDAKPGNGIAWEPFPGRTPYTKDSELMNAETAAWGRAICALGLVSNRSLASRQEVRNRRADQDADTSKKPQEASDPAPNAGSDQISDGVLNQLRESFKRSGMTNNDLCWLLLSAGVESLPAEPTSEDVGKAMRGLTLEQAFRLNDLIQGKDESVPGSGESA